MLFYYSACTAEGTSVRGSLESESLDQAIAHLRARTLFITTVCASDSLVGTARGLTALFAPTGRAREAFFRAASTLVGAGIGVRQVLETLADGCRDATLTEALRSVAADVDRGESFAGAVARHPREFSRTVVALLRAGEARGTLDAALVEVAALEERTRGLRRKLGAALTYPAFVTIGSLVLLGFLVATTMPAFALMFAQLHVPLPASTRALLALGRILNEPASLPAGVAVGVASIFALRLARRNSATFRWALDASLLRLPLIGGAIGKTLLARFARTLGTLVSGGVELTSALSIAIETVDNAAYRGGLAGVDAALRRGETLVRSLEQSAVFDGTFVQLIRAGEETGTIDAMLLRLANYYEADVEMALSAIGSAIEPLLICILGGAIGTIVASVIIPLYAMIGGIR